MPGITLTLWLTKLAERIGQYSKSAARDRLTFSLALALIIHVAFFFAVRFDPPIDQAQMAAPDIVLSLKSSRTVPDNVQVLSNVNTNGEDDEAQLQREEAMLSPPIPSEQNAMPVAPIAKRARDDAGPTKPLVLARDLSTYIQPGWRAFNTVGQSDRVKRISSVKAKASPEAFYLESWKRKIEAIGNLNYPAEAKAEGIYGRLRVLVSIYPNGQLKEARILSSSGHPVLDQAALNIIDLASPFAPFPTALRKEADLLEIDRVWEFRRQGGGLRFGS